MISWINERNSLIDLLFFKSERAYFTELKSKYLHTQKLKKIYILFPYIDRSWWIMDLDCNKWQYIGSSENKNYPYFEVEEFDIYET